ncbi:hypothetical protein L1987_63956 [Smallanthus sonchifolius]|uniref:Uncharacterized protein n=1 Tax=Smallanthus sonchifolius TaxID=185202 RepID=A0ACB9CEQ9_9ASTR|nr:hypothetical protein L1987_63956 [Smallanthus sonchifolius]
MFHPKTSFESLEHGLHNQTTFSGKLSLHEDDEEIYGVLSFIFWTFTLIALLKYVLIVMSADDNGEGGTFALYSLLCRHAKLCMLPNQQETDEKLSAYGVKKTAETWQSFALKSFFEKHTKFRKGLLIFLLLGTCMTIGDGVFTPAISVLSAVSGVRIKVTGLHENYIVAISCVLLVGLFSIQHHGTHRVAFLFAPIVTAWLLSIAGIGIYNIIQWNPQIFQALSPVYMVKLQKRTRHEGWLSLGGVVLSITGVETMFADLGHFSTLSVKLYLCGTKGLMVSSFNGAGLAVTIVMFVTTCLMTMVMIIVWKQRIVTAAAFLVLFGSVELLYLSAAFFKVPKGGWISLLLSLTFMSVMFVWNHGKLKKHQFDLENKVSMNRILSLGPSLRMVRVPGIRLVSTNLATGIPAIFCHFVTNLPAFHQVLVFVCVKSVQVQYVRAEERMLMGRVGPREYHMFRCIVRYGYKDVPHENYNFENRLVSALVEFLEIERKVKDEYGDTESENNDENVPERVFTLPDHEEKMVRSLKEIEESFSGCLETHPGLKDETVQIVKARESGIAYILGHSYAKSQEIVHDINEVCNRCCLLVFEQELQGNRCGFERASYFVARSWYDLLCLKVKRSIRYMTIRYMFKELNDDSDTGHRNSDLTPSNDTKSPI